MPGMRNEQWNRVRKPLTEADVAEALRLLDKAGSRSTEPGDELPKGYRPIRERRRDVGERTRAKKVS